MKGTLSILGILEIHPDLLDELTAPEEIDLSLLKDNILIECAELEVLYADYQFFKYAIGVWSTKQLPVWERMKRAIDAEYNPLENYDRREEWTDAEENSRNANTSSVTHSDGGTSDTSYHYVHGFNDNAQVLQSQDTATGSTDSDGTSNVTGSESGTKDATHSGRTHGNSGGTTSQQMLEAELDIAPRLNIYDIISKDFRNRFCILIY